MKAGTSMCCVSIGYTDVLLSADDGLKLVKLLTGATLCDKTFGAKHEYVYQVEPTALRVELTVLRPDQVRMPDGAVAEPATPRRSARRLGTATPLLERTR